MADQAERLRQVYQQETAKKGIHKISPSGSCRVVSVSSGKGGVGKTNLVVNLAISLAQKEMRVIIIDADLGMANVDILVNAYPRYTLEEVLEGTKDVKDIMLEGPYSIKIIPGGSGAFNLANLDQEKRNRLLDRFRLLEQEADVLLIDTAAGLSRNVMNFVGAADEAVVVTTPEPTALTDAYGMIKVMNEGALKSRIYVAINFADHLAQGEDVFQRLKRVVDKYLPGMELVFLGTIFRDAQVARAVQECAPVVLNYPNSPAAEAIQRLSKRFIDQQGIREGQEEKKGDRGLTSFIKKLQKFWS